MIDARGHRKNMPFDAEGTNPIGNAVQPILQSPKLPEWHLLIVPTNPLLLPNSPNSLAPP